MITRGANPCIRHASREDVHAISAVAAMSGQPSWNEGAVSEAIENPQAIVLVCDAEEAVVGFCVLYHAADEGEIPSIAVSDRFRRRGIGSLLIEAIASEAYDRGVLNIYLEVRQSNAAARGLYESTGFVEAGIRKRFYRDPIEDAIVMVRNL